MKITTKQEITSQRSERDSADELTQEGSLEVMNKIADGLVEIVESHQPEAALDETLKAVVSLLGSTGAWLLQRRGVDVVQPSGQERVGIERAPNVCIGSMLEETTPGGELSRAQLTMLRVPPQMHSETWYFLPLSEGSRRSHGLVLLNPHVAVLKKLLPSLTSQISSLLRVAGLSARRQRNEFEMRSSNDRHRSLINSVVDGLLTIQVNGDILSVNPAAMQMFGYDLLSFTTLTMRDLAPELFTEEDGEQRLAPESLARGIVEIEAIRSDGSSFPVELSLSKTDTSNDEEYVALLRDISERKELERIKGEFVSTVSHELRTPLASVHGSLGLLTAGVLQELHGDAKETAELAERNCSRLLRLINDLLDAQRMRTGKLELEKQNTSSEEVALTALETLTRFAEQHDVSLKLTAPDEYNFVADGHRIEQVLVNLMSNAIKFSQKGGSVELRIRDGENGIVFDVVDNGRGIPAEALGTIFEPFHQVESSDSRRAGGTGLGLAICKSIVELHDGVIRVSSTPNIETVFSVSLPKG